jgi:chromate transporter
MSVQAAEPQQSAAHLGEIVRVFLKLGFTAFGGPAAHIAMMREEMVTRRQWLDDTHFADLLGAVNLIPGPSSTELGIYLGYVRGGWLGLIAGGVCFIGPAMIIVLALAWVYVTFGHLPAIGDLLYGIKPVVLAIIAQALWGLSRTIFRSVWSVMLAVGVLAGYLLGISPLLLLFGAGVLLALLHAAQGKNTGFLWPLARNGAFGVATTSVVGFSYLTLFLTFLKIGAILFGSGYVLLAFLHADFVVQLHWLTNRQLLDAVAVGQFTPGPVFTTATFIGYVVGGLPGALLATLAIFLPAFVYVPLIAPIATRLRRNPVTGAFLDGVNAAALALMAGVLLQLGQVTLIDPLTVLIAGMALVLLLRFRVNSAWLILAGGTIGLIWHLVIA